MTANSDDSYPGPEGLSATSLPANVAVRYAKLGTDEERLALAANPALPTDVALLLSRDANLGVRQTLAGNNGTEVEVLAELSRDPDMDLALIAGNWNAPVALKLLLPLWKMTRRSMDKFLLSVHASPEERERLLVMHAGVGPRSKLLLGDAWRKIR